MIWRRRQQSDTSIFGPVAPPKSSRLESLFAFMLVFWIIITFLMGVAWQCLLLWNWIF